jgi:hypothetical protein
MAGTSPQNSHASAAHVSNGVGTGSYSGMGGRSRRHHRKSHKKSHRKHHKKSYRKTRRHRRRH